MKQLYSAAIILLLAFTASAQSAKELRLLHTSDMHSRIESIHPEAADEYAGMGGMMRRASFVQQYRSQHPDALLFDGGDFSQGTPYYNFFQGEIEIALMNEMKYDAMTIGNHEFDFGLQNMARLYRLAQFPVVCANYDLKGTELEELVKPYIILERNGLRIGIFGLSPQMDGLVQADKCAGIVYKDPIATAQDVSTLLKKNEKCDVVICLSHLGMHSGNVNDEVLAAKTKNIDLILGGHSHTFMKKPTNYPNAAGKNLPIFHTGKSGIYVGEVVLTMGQR